MQLHKKHSTQGIQVLILLDKSHRFPPTLSREIGAIYVERLLDQGELLISSLARFIYLENQNRKDDSEGQLSYGEKLGTPESKIPVLIHGQNGEILKDVGYWIKYSARNMFALSLTNLTRTPPNPRDFFTITNVELFWEIVGNKLHSEFDIGMDLAGHCFYTDDALSLPNQSVEQIHKNPPAAFLVKPLKFSHESEFRMMWIPYYSGTACIFIKRRIRKYGYIFTEEDLYWPTSFPPPNDERIPETYILHCPELKRCVAPLRGM